MRVLFLCRDFPGGTQPWATAVVQALPDVGVDVRVITNQESEPATDHNGCLRIVHVPEYPPMVPPGDAVSWSLHFSLAVLESATAMQLSDPVDVVHVHDWPLAYAALALRRTFGLPLVTSFSRVQYAQKRGRLSTSEDLLVHQLEWWLAAESQAILVPSPRARDRVARLFVCPADRIAVIRRDGSRGPSAAATAAARAYERAARERGGHRKAYPSDALGRQLRLLFERSAANVTPA